MATACVSSSRLYGPQFAGWVSATCAGGPPSPLGHDADHPPQQLGGQRLAAIRRAAEEDAAPGRRAGA